MIPGILAFISSGRVPWAQAVFTNDIIYYLSISDIIFHWCLRLQLIHQRTMYVRSSQTKNLDRCLLIVLFISLSAWHLSTAVAEADTCTATVASVGKCTETSSRLGTTRLQCVKATYVRQKADSITTTHCTKHQT